MNITYESLLEGNKKWAKRILDQDPEYFVNQAKGQTPPILWIGCSDSRVPANQITDTPPGSIFVHRNIANVVVHSDLNLLSVVDYAVNALKVKHVIVCGHYGCGGVLAAMSDKQFGLVDNWIRHIKDVYRTHRSELELIQNQQERADRLVELNVLEQVSSLCRTSIIQNAWTERKMPQVHGWVYNIGEGLIRELDITVSSNSDLEKLQSSDFVMK
jgi:carbonic anhydrase